MNELESETEMLFFSSYIDLIIYIRAPLFPFVTFGLLVTLLYCYSKLWHLRVKGSMTTVYKRYITLLNRTILTFLLRLQNWKILQYLLWRIIFGLADAVDRVLLDHSSRQSVWATRSSLLLFRRWRVLRRMLWRRCRHTCDVAVVQTAVATFPLALVRGCDVICCRRDGLVTVGNHLAISGSSGWGRLYVLKVFL